MARLSAKTKVQPVRSYISISVVERSVLCWLVAFAVLCCLLVAPAAAGAERACANGWHAEIVSVEGLVEIDTPSGWTPAQHLRTETAAVR